MRYDFVTRRFEAALNQYAEEAKQLYVQKVKEGDHVASTELIKSVQTRVEVNGTTYQVIADLAKHWKYLEGGSKGAESSPPGAVWRAHFPPIRALMRWIEIKPVTPRLDSRGRVPSTRSLAYLIGRKIKNFGIEPYPALTTTVEELNAKYLPILSAALMQDATSMITEEFKGLPEQIRR